MFENFFEKISEGDWNYIIVLIWCVLRIGLGIVEVIAARMGVKIYRKEKTMDKNGIIEKRGKATTFTEYKDEYALDDHDNLLKTGKKIDVQAQIQSHRSKCMDRILDKFLEQQIGLPEGEPVYGDGTNMYQDPKEAYANALAYAEALRLKYNIPVEDDGKYIEPVKVLEDLNADNEELKAILTPETKTAEQLEYELFLKWKEEQNR